MLTNEQLKTEIFDRVCAIVEEYATNEYISDTTLLRKMNRVLTAVMNNWELITEEQK